MSTIRLRRGSGAPSASSFVEGEPAWDSTNGKLYIKSAAGTMVQVGGGTGGGAYTFSSTPPTSPSAGDRWTDADDGITYEYVNDGDSSQWVELGPVGQQGATGLQGDTGVGVIAGGTTGQVLSKASNTDYDTAWTTVAAGTDINGQTQVQSALNDELIIYDTSASANRKALVRDIGCQGVGGWGSTDKIHTNYLTGSSFSSNAFTVDRIYYIPILFPQTWTFNTVGTRLGAASGSASNVARFGLYHMNNGFPGNLAADFGVFNLGGANNSERQISINYTVEAGFYYTAFVTNDSVATFNRQSVFAIAELHLFTGLDTVLDGSSTHLYQQLAGSAAGGLPATASSIIKGVGNHPVVYFQNV